MPVSDSGMRSSVDDYNMSTGTRPKSPQEQTSRSKLQRQVSMTKHEYLGDEEHKRRQFSKQESKDSGIVTEMSLRPKDLDLTRSESVKARKKVEKTPSMRSSHSAKSKGGSMKYKQRSKTTSDLVPVNSNEENEVSFLFLKLSTILFYRNLANHLYSKVYETQEDMCRKRNEIRMANIQLAAVRAQVSVLGYENQKFIQKR